MNYRIVGADGKTYGPVTLEQIRQWLAEGRVESRTPVHVEGAREWTTLALLPELGAMSGPPQTIGALPPGAGSARTTNGFATAGLVCSVLSWVCCCCLPFNLLAIIFCIIALVQINSQAQPQGGRTLAIVGLVLAVANLCFGSLLALLQMALGNNSFNFPTGQF